jgi:hypothetical protein
VHEATHARLGAFPYKDGTHQRHERICIRRELDFATKLHGANDISSWAHKRLATVDTDYEDTNLKKSQRIGQITLAREAGFPEWIIRILAFRYGRE